MKIKYQIKRWLGLFTREGRDNLPVGALEDVENLVFNTKSFKPSLRTGYSAGLSGSLADISGDTTITSYRYPRGVHPATEIPSAQNIVVLCGTDGSAGKHYFQRPFWKHGAGTIDSTNWLKWGETLSTTIASVDSAAVFQLTAGNNTTDDYYNNFLIYNETRTEYSYVSDYSTLGGNRIVTAYEALPSDWAMGDTVHLYRHFHDNPTFAPSWSDPIVLKQGNDILASGGQSSTVGNKGIWSGYINKTWFAGASLNPSYNGTYVSESEIKTTAGITCDSNVAGAATVAVDDSVAKRAFSYLVFETHDGQRSNPVSLGYDDLTAGSVSMATAALVTRVRVAFSRMNKRIGKIHYFGGIVDVSSGRESLEWDEIFYLTTSNIITDGADWAVNAPGAAPGDFSKFFTLDGNAWNSRGEDLATFLGHTEPNRSTVSFSHGIIIGGRLFVSKYYDYNSALSYNDQVNFSPFASNGVSQWNKLLDIDDQVQTSIEAGDPSTIKGLAHLDGKLFIAKDRGIYFIDITYDPSQWILNTVTREIGCDAPDSVVTTPEGIIWAKKADGIYLWRGGDPIELTRNWRDTYRALTNSESVPSWWGWYDPYYRSYRMMYTADGTTKTTVYEAFLDVTDPAIGNLPIWTKHIMAHNVGQVTVRSDGAVFFSTGAAATYQFSSSATDDAGTGIKPYFKLGTRVIDEHKIFVFQAFNLTVSQSGGTSGQLDISNYVDGNVVGTFTNLTKTASRFSSELPDIDSDGHTRHGYNFDFAFNSNATRGVLGTSYTIFDLTIDGYLMERGGDVRQSL